MSDLVIPISKADITRSRDAHVAFSKRLAAQRNARFNQIQEWINTTVTPEILAWTERELAGAGDPEYAPAIGITVTYPEKLSASDIGAVVNAIEKMFPWYLVFSNVVNDHIDFIIKFSYAQ